MGGRVGRKLRIGVLLLSAPCRQTRPLGPPRRRQQTAPPRRITVTVVTTGLSTLDFSKRTDYLSRSNNRVSLLTSALRNPCTSRVALMLKTKPTCAVTQNLSAAGLLEVQPAVTVGASAIPEDSDVDGATDGVERGSVATEDEAERKGIYMGSNRLGVQGFEEWLEELHGHMLSHF
ncbi:hypothetical protein F4780DRAFT_296509 [Xylariomycetidae sp. FL0641]|nr:hypothetical protein F4780DRAFT_296509 [Xylariomycetidae sp. FL0641]